MRVDLVILDELGYVPFGQSGGALLFHLLSKLYEHTSVMVTTNLGGGLQVPGQNSTDMPGQNSIGTNKCGRT